MKKLITIMVFFVCLTFSTFVSAADGVTDQKIVFGQSAALNGPAAALGNGMKDGLLAAFKEANDAGGVNGRVLELISYDDGYEPETAITNAKKLILEDKVFALIGGVGTPTANAVQPITSEHETPFIGPFTGAEFLRSPFKRYVVNVRASYWQETEEWVERLTTDLGIKRIAILYQDDTYGRAGLSGVKRALEKRGMSLVGEGSYKRNTIAVKSAVLSIRKSNPEAVVMVGAYKPCAEFIRVSHKVGFSPKFVNISFVGSDALAKDLKEEGNNVIVSQVVPFPFNSSESLLVKNYQKAIKEYDSESDFGFVSLEGYLVGRLSVEILKNMDGNITREGFLDKLYEIADITIDDLTLHYGKEDNQGMDKVFMTILKGDGTFLSVNELSQ